MQVIERDTEGQDAARAIGHELPLCLQRSRIDEDRACFRFAKTRLGKHHPRRLAFRNGWPDGEQSWPLAHHLTGSSDLLRERPCRPLRRSHQLVAIEPAFDLRRQHVKRAAQRRKEDERCDEQADIEMQPDHEQPEGAFCLGAADGSLSSHDRPP